MRLRILLWAIVVIFFFHPIAFAKWYPGYIHGPHTTFSDGIRPPEDAYSKVISSGVAFDCFSDHYELIDSSKKQAHQVIKDYGFDNYLRRLSSTPKLVSLPGAELKARFQDHNTHTIGIGKIRKDPELDRLQGKEGSQQMIIDQLRVMGLIPVAAHPSAITVGSISTNPTNPTNYYYDRTSAKGLMGVEFGNESIDCDKETFAWYLDISNRFNVFATFGNDSHFPYDKDDNERFERKNYVWVDGAFTEDSLMESLRKGKVYGASFGMYISSMNLLPGFEWQKVKRPYLEFDIQMPQKTEYRKIVMLYHDGESRPVYMKVYEPDVKNAKVRFLDPRAGIGKHKYILRVQGFLVTSPFYLDVTGPNDWGNNDEVKRNPSKMVARYFENWFKHQPNELNEYYARNSQVSEADKGILKRMAGSNPGWGDCTFKANYFYVKDDRVFSDVEVILKNSSGAEKSTWVMIKEDGEWKIFSTNFNRTPKWLAR